MLEIPLPQGVRLRVRSASMSSRYYNGRKEKTHGNYVDLTRGPLSSPKWPAYFTKGNIEADPLPSPQ